MKINNYMINLYSTILFISTMALTYAEERKTADIIQAISKTTEVVDNDLVITMKNEGQRYLFSTDDSKPRVLEYKEIIRLKAGFLKATFKSRGYTLTITSIKDSPGQYTIEEVIDTRSLGGEIKHNTRSFTIAKNELQEAQSK
jgi:hypothetical protein